MFVSHLVLQSVPVPRSTLSMLLQAVAAADSSCSCEEKLIHSLSFFKILFSFLNYACWSVFCEFWLHCALVYPSLGKAWHPPVCVVIIKPCHSVYSSDTRLKKKAILCICQAYVPHLRCCSILSSFTTQMFVISNSNISSNFHFFKCSRVQTRVESVSLSCTWVYLRQSYTDWLQVYFINRKRLFLMSS